MVTDVSGEKDMNWKTIKNFNDQCAPSDRVLNIGTGSSNNLLVKKSALIIIGKNVSRYTPVVIKTERQFSYSPKITIENKGFENVGR